MLLNDELVGLFNDSWSRCQASREMFSVFYGKFIGAHTEVAEKFAKVDMRKQQVVLQGSVYMLMLASQGNAYAREYLTQLAERHSRRQLNIRPELYELWLRCLIETVSELDPRFDSKVEAAWRDVMAYGISFMQAGY